MPRDRTVSGRFGRRSVQDPGAAGQSDSFSWRISDSAGEYSLSASAAATTVVATCLPCGMWRVLWRVCSDQYGALFRAEGSQLTGCVGASADDCPMVSVSGFVLPCRSWHWVLSATRDVRQVLACGRWTATTYSRGSGYGRNCAARTRRVQIPRDEAACSVCRG